VEQQAIDVVLIEDSDRLARFSFGYLEEAFEWKQVRLEVVEPPKMQTPTEELVQDLFTIVTVFSGRLYGGRAKRVRQCISQCLHIESAEETDGPNRQNDETPA
jgi:predicted site-specific integrase-resolvase